MQEILNKIKKTFRHPFKGYRFIINKLKQSKLAQDLLWSYYYFILPKPKVRTGVPHDPKIQKEITKELKENGFNIIDLYINIADYRQYINNAEYHKFANQYSKEAFIEKSLEHYLAAELLNLSKNDIYIDIASGSSPVPEIYHNLYECIIYKQDLAYPKGINGNIIGGDASNMPIEDNFATKMALHCSFEHFEQDRDIRFIKEAGRVLKRGGQLCIVPLYLYNKYAIQTDPAVLPKDGLSFEKEAVLYCAKGWRNRHGRFYDVPHYISRIRNNQGNLKLTIYIVQNEKEVDASCYVKFIAMFEKE
jgi:SAM-dependent methyltransferase